MKIAIAASLLATLCFVAPASAQLHGPAAPDSLSVQGLLTDTGGNPLTTSTDMTFKLYKGGSEVWSQTLSGVSVTNGVFNVILGGSGAESLDPVAFNEPIDLGIKVGTDDEMTPRTPLVGAAYALGMRGMYAVELEADIPQAEGIWKGTNVIGGSPNNSVEADVTGATISGGGGFDAGQTSQPNRVLDSFGTIGGGSSNDAGGLWDTIAGGAANETDGPYAAIGGGSGNSALGVNSSIAGGYSNSAGGFEASVGGGSSNAARTSYSTVAGGFFNVASGQSSTVPGGNRNQARGDYSLASGYKARAIHEGSFVWNDRSVTELNDSLVSTADNQFLVRAAGGVGIGTSQPTPESLTISRKAESSAYQLEIRNEGDIHAPNYSGIAFTQAADGSTELGSVKLVYHSNGFPDMSFGVRGTADALYIESGGQVGIGTASPGDDLEVNGNITAVGVTETSDARMKRNVAPIEDAMSLVRRLRGVRFDWDREAWPDRKFDSARQMGLIAQEVEELVPEVVAQGDDGYYSLAYAKLVPLLIEAIKEEQVMIASQDEQIASQNERIAALEARIRP